MYDLFNLYLLKSNLCLLRIWNFNILSIFRHFRSGADVTFHVYGPKKEEKRLRSILNKWADRGYVGNITISEKDTSLRSLLSLQVSQLNLKCHYKIWLLSSPFVTVAVTLKKNITPRVGFNINSISFCRFRIVWKDSYALYWFSKLDLHIPGASPLEQEKIVLYPVLLFFEYLQDWTNINLINM